ncbi:MAG: hypothetical protein HY000_22175 [Planctomycetes bacterium]|nr:hypothetical protein [Planctomycetota bacterium]
MNTITPLDVMDLLTSTTCPCVSIYLPTGPGGGSAPGDQIQLKNLIVQAQSRLERGGLRRVAAREMLAPARELLTNPSFWRGCGQGLALFAAPHTFRVWQTPTPFEPLLWVGPRSYLKPLLPLIGANTRFLLLAVSENHVRLLAGDRFRLNEVQVEGLPQSLDEALNYQHPEGMVQTHSAQPAFRGKEGVVFHGQGGAPDERQVNLVAYFRVIDEALRTYFREEKSPLVFAGVAHLQPIFRQVNSYPHLLDQAVVGNPDYSSPVELRDKALPILEPYWQQDRRKDAERIIRMAGTERVSAGIEEIVRAAQAGRVDALFVAADAQVWGRFDPASGEVSLAADGGASDEDLLDAAACAAWRNGGRVHVVKASEVPLGLLASALFRYPAAHLAGVGGAGLPSETDQCRQGATKET